jgi:hypothetical protein
VFEFRYWNVVSIGVRRRSHLHKIALGLYHFLSLHVVSHRYSRWLTKHNLHARYCTFKDQVAYRYIT